MRDVEVTAKTVEEAVDQALKELNATRNQVYVDVLDSGRKGLLGIGQGQARVRVRLLEAGEEPDEINEVEEPAEIDEATDQAAALDADLAVDQELDEVAAAPAGPAAGEFATLDDLADYAAEVVEQIIERMKVPGTVEIVEPEEPSEAGEETIYLDIVGPEVGALIGRRAETLNSLQFLVNLIITKQTGRRVRVVVDADGYRVRREESLTNLAQRMAERVLSTAQPVILEAMPANERRIVHLAISQIEGVTTESTGEAEQRKVVILPAKTQAAS